MNKMTINPILWLLVSSLSVSAADNTFCAGRLNLNAIKYIIYYNQRYFLRDRYNALQFFYL